MASNDIKQPVRVRKLETGKIYYPDELVEKDGELYVYNSDGSTSIRINNSVKLLNSAKATIGTIDPISGADITIPDATTSAPGLMKFSTTAPSNPAANASVGSEAAAARADHVHPLQSDVSGNAGTATTLKTPRSIGISGVTATAATFDGSKDVSINISGIPASIISGLGTVATSNSYNDLNNKPTIYGLAGTADIPKENGTAEVGTATRSARADHVHPLQTTVDTANKLSTSAGNTTTPVYFKDGVPTALEYTIAKSVPADALFTDTKYTHPTTSGNKHIPSGGSNNQILRWSADGTAKWDYETQWDNIIGEVVLKPNSDNSGYSLGTFTLLDYDYDTIAGTILKTFSTSLLHVIYAPDADEYRNVTAGFLSLAGNDPTSRTLIFSGSIASSLNPKPTNITVTYNNLDTESNPVITIETSAVGGDSGTIVSASTTATDGSSIIANPLSTSISDSAQIYQNGILLTKNTHYSINSDGNIALNGYTAEDGDIFTVVSKSTGVDTALTATGANITLVNTAGYFDSVNNVESAIAKIGAKLNGGVVAGVRVNGTVATPDSNGVVDVASPTIQVNGSTVTPSTTGVVNITNVVKTTGATMTGNLVAKAASAGNHVRNISLYSSTDTLPTTGNDGDIIFVYDANS